MKRISKFLSDNGICSRRMAEQMIQDGRISVNGKKITTPVTFITNTDKVAVDGKLILSTLHPAPKTLYMFHKPVGCICSAKDPEGRRTIYDILPEQYRNLKYVGRLDYNTSGLLLMTNDGGLLREMTLPSNGLERTYIAKLGGTMTMDDAHFLRVTKPARKGIKIDGVIYRPMILERLSATDVKITITEGKKNEIRRVFEYLGLPVRKLHRISYGKYVLWDLKPGEIRKVEN